MLTCYNHSFVEKSREGPQFKQRGLTTLNLNITNTGPVSLGTQSPESLQGRVSVRACVRSADRTETYVQKGEEF